MYRFGLYVNIDLKKAFELYSKSFELNNNNAIINLGEMYFFGLFVEKNFEKYF